jgi:hypothetical protein
MKRSILVASLLAICVTLPGTSHAGIVSRAVERHTAKKGDRFFHEKGILYKGTFTKPDGTVLPAQVRLSRGRPTPVGKPEILSAAAQVKTPHGLQDLHLVTARGDAGLKARLVAFKERYAGETLTSIFATFQKGSVKGPLVSSKLASDFAAPIDGGPAKGLHSYDVSIKDGMIRSFVKNTAARVGIGRGAETLHLGKVTIDMDSRMSVADSVAFKTNPTTNDAMGVKAVGIANYLRGVFMPASQAGRAATDVARETAKARANGI